MPRRVVPILMVPGTSSRQPSRSRCSGRISTAWLAILRFSGVTLTPWPDTFFTSSRKCQGSTTTPLPMIESLPLRTTPDGSSASL